MARRICLRDVGVLSRCSRWIMFERSKQIKVARGVDKAGGVCAMKFGREKGDDRIFANIASPELYKRLYLIGNPFYRRVLSVIPDVIVFL